MGIPLVVDPIFGASTYLALKGGLEPPNCEWQASLNLNTILRVNHPHHSPTSPSHLESLNLEPEVAGVTAATTNPDILEKSTIEPPEVEYLIHKL